MADFDIKYTDYIPAQGYSLEDLSKILYKEDRDLQKANLEALGNIVESTERITNLPIQYLDSLEFLPGEQADTSVIKERINDIVGTAWDEKKSPAELARLVRDIGAETGPNGTIGKATRRNAAHNIWLANEENNKALSSLSDEENRLLIQENIDKLLGTQDTAVMNNIALADKVAALPDFNKVLSNDSMKSILAKSEFDNRVGSFIRRSAIGLPKDIAAEVINGIIQQDESINRWIEQYNRIYGLENPITLDNAIDKNGNVKEDLPPQLKGALRDAFGRATAPSETLMPLSVGSGSGGGYSNRSNGGGGSKNTIDDPMFQTTEHIIVPRAMNSAAVSELSQRPGSEGYIENFRKSMSNFFTGLKYSKSFLNTNWDNIFFFTPDKEEKDKLIYDIDKINERFIKDRITLRYVVGKNETYIFDKKNKLITSFDGKVSTEQFTNQIKAYYETLNDFYRKSNAEIGISFYDFPKAVDATKYNKKDFSMIMTNEAGTYAVDDAEMKNVKKIKSFNSFSYGNMLGDISFKATVVMNNDEEKQVILKISNHNKIGDYMKLAQRNVGNNREDWGTRWVLENPYLCAFTSSLERQPLQYDKKSHPYRGITLNDGVARAYGLKFMPVAFYGTEIRIMQQKMNDGTFADSVYFVDKDGNRIGNYVENSVGNLLFRFNNYFESYYNTAASSLADDADLTEYNRQRCTGIEYDADIDKDGVQIFFPPKNGSYDKNTEITSELKSIVLMLDRKGKSLKDTSYVAKTIKKSDGKDYLINVNRASSTGGVFVGDLIQPEGSNEAYIILPFAGNYVMCDKDFKFKGIVTNDMIKNTENKIFQGKYRGEKIY